MLSTATISMDKIEQAAERLRKAATSLKPVAPVRDLLGVTDIAAAYAAQDINTNRALAEGRRLVGRKIGLTARVVQQQLGVDQPDYGMLFADMAVEDGGEVTPGEVMQAKVEGEIAFVMDRDLAADQPIMADLVRAIAYAVPAIEIVGSRVADWDIRITDTVADNASSGKFVLGTRPCRLDEADLRLCGMVMERRGEVVSLGVGAACMGNPLTTALWLARKMAVAGRPLRAGDILLSGALGPMVTVTPGDAFTVTIDRIGSVRVGFAAA